MWKCKHCGKEIIVEVLIDESYDFTIDEKGNPDEFCSSFFESIEKHVKEEPYIFEKNYKCNNCDEESEVLKDIAYWEE